MFGGRKVGEVGGFSVQCQMACVKETPQVCLSWIFVYLLPSPDFSKFPVSPPDIATWLKSGLNTSKGMLTDGLHFGERELSHEKQLEKNVGPSPKTGWESCLEGGVLCTLQSVELGPTGEVTGRQRWALFLLHPNGTFGVLPR